MGLKAAVQALKKAEPLKDKVQRCKDLLTDSDAWICQQQLQKIYQQVLILDLEYALDRKVEQELWNLGFKNYIATLQSQAKDRRNLKRGESQAMLSWCLEAASGFYLTLLQEICTAFDLDLPFRRKGYIYGCISPWKAVEKLSAPNKSSCFYACQYCLVHLGDIARYRNQNKQAELFYRHAVSLSPSSGQPYNQLALLEASRGDKLGTVFHYARSVAVKHPFPVATANLSKTLSSALNDKSFNIEGKTKLTSQEYIAVFLKVHGLLHNLEDLQVATTYVKLLSDALTALVATESFSSWRLVQMLVINLYALQHMAGSTIDNTEILTIEQLSSDEKLARDCILDLLAGSLSALLLPVYTIKNAIIDYFALPTIKLCLDWIRLRPTVLEETAFASRLQIWPSLCVLLNGLQACVVDFDYNQYAKVPLPEDRDLQGFLPLEKSFETLRFTNTDLEGDVVMLNKLRAMRILHLGRRIAQYQVKGSTLITLGGGEQPGDQKFTSTIEGAEPSNELMKELEELSLNKEKQPIVASSPAPSESASSKGSSEIDCLMPDITSERRVGILKSRGSLERNRDTINIEVSGGHTESNSLPQTRKPRQNVAMQAIMRRAENEQKQVTFKNVSPVTADEESPSKLIATTTVSPIKVNGNKQMPTLLQTAVSNSIVTSNPVVTIQNRQAQNVSMTDQKQNSSQSTTITTQPEHKNSPPTQMNQFSLIDQHSMAVGQFSQLATICYPNQFNMQRPQFTKNCLPIHIQSSFSQGSISQVPISQGSISQGPISQGPISQGPISQGPISPYPMTGQFNASPQTLQNVAFQQSVGQNRIVQRGNLGPSQSTQMLPQGMNLAPSSQQAIGQGLPQNIGLQQQGVPMQQNNAIGMHPQQGMLGNSHRPNGLNMPSQLSVPISGYQTSVEIGNPASITNNPISSSAANNLAFNYQNFPQNNFGQIQQNQLSPATYSKNCGQFSFIGQNQNVNKNQPVANNYPIYHGYEAKDYNPWKEPQPPQPPGTWWGSSSQLPHGKDTANTDAFQNWANSTNPGSRIGDLPLISGNNYQPPPLQGRHYGARNSFEETRPFEVDQKQQQQPTSTGNTYSLFSWGVTGQISNPSSQDQMKKCMSQQSLWSGPGPSPLERLLEQQKSLREGGT